MLELKGGEERETAPCEDEGAMLGTVEDEGAPALDIPTTVEEASPALDIPIVEEEETPRTTLNTIEDEAAPFDGELDSETPLPATEDETTAPTLDATFITGVDNVLDNRVVTLALALPQTPYWL